jgi:DNA-binding MarR family transcriptional regulator
VAERLVASVPDVPRLLDRLEGMRLISRERDPADRRHVTARITQKGLELLDRVLPDLEAVMHARTGRLNQRMLAGLIDGLARIREAQ